MNSQKVQAVGMSLQFIQNVVESYNRNQDRMRACSKIVSFVERYGGLQKCPQIWAYVSGPNGGPGWMDECQNALIVNLLSSDTLFQETKGDKPAGADFYFHESSFEDIANHSKWSFQREEWRMGSERFFLKVFSPQNEAPPKAVMISPDWVATSGSEPKGRVSSYDEWVEFLVGT